MEKLAQLGGVSGLARAICSHEHEGLDPKAAARTPGSGEEHSRVFGPNTYKQVASKNFFALCWDNIQDPIILLLIAAALVRCCAPLALRRGASARATVEQRSGRAGCRIPALVRRAAA